MQFCRYLAGGISFLFIVISSSLPAWSQGNVDENLETAVIYVDGTKGSDSNPGTKSRPLKTIGAAASLAETNNQDSIGTRVIINPGTYRESVTISPPYKGTNLPVTFQALTNGTVYVSGAQKYSGWKVYSGNNQIYTNTWSYAWGLCSNLSGAPVAPDIVLRREMVFVNGVHLTQVLSLSEVMAGTFYVDEAHGNIYVWPPSGVNMSTADVEVAVEPTLFTVGGQSNVVLRGLTFEYANSCLTDAAVVVSGAHTFSNVLFDSDTFVWNNAHGLSVSNPLTYFTVQNSVANHNGVAGIQSDESKYGLFSSDVASYNNWRGAQGVYYTWNASGAHYFQLHDQTIEGLSTYYNQTFGVHFDTDNQNITSTSEVSFGNLLSAMFVEKNEGPISFSAASFCSALPASYTTNVPLKLRNSENVSFTGGFLMNGYDDIWVTGQAGGIKVTNWETGQHYNLVTQNLTLMQNVIETGSDAQVFSDAGLGGSDWSSFKNTLISNYNTWWDAATSTPWVVPEPKRGTTEDFSGWQSTTSQDKQSSWKAPSGNPGLACSAAPDLADYWLVVPDDASPVTIKRGSSAVFTATMVPLGWTNAAQLSFDGVQNIAGATASWSPTSVSPNGSATFTVNTSSSTPAGTYPVVMMATSGSVTRTITILLTVH